MSAQITHIPFARFYPWKIVFFSIPDGYKRKFSSMEEQRKKSYSGMISSNISAKIRDRCYLLHYITPRRKIFNPLLDKDVYFRLSFITLTLSASQSVADREITRNLLAPFIRHFRYTGHLKNYVWKAEKQKNGNIHYHILSDMFVTFSELLSYWNYCQSKTDMIDRFYLKYGHRMPNSVDIRQVKSGNSAAKYISKYFSKSSDRIEGKTWDCSRYLESFNFPTYIIDSHKSNKIEALVSEYSTGSAQFDYCRVVYMDSKYYQKVI